MLGDIGMNQLTYINEYTDVNARNDALVRGKRMFVTAHLTIVSPSKFTRQTGLGSSL